MQNKTNITTGKKFATPENYKGINTPYFSAGDYENKKPIEQGNARQFFSKGITFKKERSILEFLGQKITLEIKDVKTLLCPIVEKRQDGTQEQTEEERPFLVLSFVGGSKEYYFSLNSIMLDTLIKNGLLQDKEQDKQKAVLSFPYTENEIFGLIGQRVSGYFYYTMENGGGKKLFSSAENCEAYHNAIQARFENTIQNTSEQTPQEQEKEN
jgi:hypothetical protein